MTVGSVWTEPGQGAGPTPPPGEATPLGARRALISIVTPCYNEEDNVGECAQAVRRVFEEQLPDYDFEHIFCDNCSTDGTVARLKELARQDRRVKIIVNARNYGPFCSTFNGLMSTRGDAVLVLLAADLQDPPELLPRFIAGWRGGHEVVYGIRNKREEGWIMRGVRKVYYRMVSRTASITIPPDVGEFMLVDRVIVEALRRFDDHYPYIRGMVFNCGFRSTGIEYTWKARKRGFSKNRLYHLVDQALNGLVSFTKVPIRLCMGCGLVVASLSVLCALVNLTINLAYYRTLAPPGIPTLIVAVFLFAGLQLFFFGVLGEYIAAIHFQVRKRPLVVERERLNFDDETPRRAENTTAPHWRVDTPAEAPAPILPTILERVRDRR
jgi:glycosyltransferase involved in cell wall biosynthesis